jgi:hypothetical protein
MGQRQEMKKTREKKPTTTLVAVRLTNEELKALDDWSKNFEGNRSEALRALVMKKVKV